MTILVHTKSDVIFNAIAVFFKERNALCEKIVGNALSQNFSCLILDNPSKAILKEYEKNPHSPIVVLVDQNYPLKDPFVFLEKPLSMTLLFRTCLKTSKSRSQPILSIGPYTIFPKERFALHKETGTHYPLTEKEIAILDILYQSSETISRETILNYVWGYQKNIDTHTLETHIYKLRKKLFSKNTEEFLITSPRGYRLKV